MANRLKCSVFLLLLSADGCAPGGNRGEPRDEEAPLIATAVETPQGCLTEINGERIESTRTDEELVALVSRWPNRRARLRVGATTPYRCVGRLLFVLQRARFTFLPETIAD